jgi:hypothetical protein
MQGVHEEYNLKESPVIWKYDIERKKYIGPDWWDYR